MNKETQWVKKVFAEKFGYNKDWIVIRSPGRVNLIGEHTDYNEGFVLPAAIDKAIVFVIAPRVDGCCRFYAADIDENYECHRGLLQKSAQGWPNYLLGVIDQFQKAGHEIGGCDLVFGGDIPIGAGLSSSAAIEAGFAFGLNELFDFKIDRVRLVKLAQKAENEFVGVQCGIMDQFISIFGEERKVLRLDCRSLEYEYVPFERDDIRTVLCDTQVRRALASSEYNVRRRECELAINTLRRFDNNLKSLRDVSLDFLMNHKKDLEPVLYNRCEYVIRENARVLQACEDLKQNDFRSFGERMYESHQGLRDGYEVSSPELDLLVELASATGGVLGARMMGAGFGGCTINLVEESHVERFSETIQRQYREKTGQDIKVYITSIQSGTKKVVEEQIHV
ncbi:MAG: galactokinase [Ignavibacteriales bacterium]|nr:galactokinase [Ignavibacteriales bacterium]